MNPAPKARLVSTELAALAMGVTEATIRKWASRGKITRHGGPQRAHYDLTELLDLQLSAGTSHPSSLSHPTVEEPPTGPE